MRRFYAPPENFSTQKVRLDEPETRHLRDVLRLRIGDVVNVFDGMGNEFRSKLLSIGKRETSLEIIENIAPTAPESKLDLTLCATILKNDKTDLVVQKAVELGVNRFVPITSGRCDITLKAAARRTDRWRKIALEAAKQCGRARLMTVEGVDNFENAIRRESADSRTNASVYFFSERDGGKFDAAETPTSIAAFLGPEGGWDDDEIELASTLGAHAVTLGGRIMKADTAAVAISALLQHHFGDLN